MAKICPESGERVIYLTCLECDSQACRTNAKEKEKDDDGRNKKLNGNNTERK